MWAWLLGYWHKVSTIMARRTKYHRQELSHHPHWVERYMEKLAYHLERDYQLVSEIVIGYEPSR